MHAGRLRHSGKRLQDRNGLRRIGFVHRDDAPGGSRRKLRGKRFYETLGFEARALGPTLAEMKSGTHSFLLQDFYVPQYANNFVMHMFVDNLDGWWAHFETLRLEKSFRVRAPIAPRREPWGLRVAYV